MDNRNGKHEAGFTLVEVSIILFVLVILSSILLVNLGDFNRLARFARAKEDVGALCSALNQYLLDIGETAVWHWGGRDGGGAWSDTPDRTDPIGLLIGDGDTPMAPRDDQFQNWQLPFGSKFRENKDIAGTSVLFRVDTFANHLIHNTPSNNPANGARAPADMIHGGTSSGIYGGLNFDSRDGQGFNSLYAWRGPYINDRVDPDPWGNRYMANVFALYTPADMAADGFGSAVVCYTAGPDEQIDTVFNQPGGWFTGDDDITALAHAGGNR